MMASSSPTWSKVARIGCVGEAHISQQGQLATVLQGDNAAVVALWTLDPIKPVSQWQLPESEVWDCTLTKDGRILFITFLNDRTLVTTKPREREKAPHA